MTAYQLQAGLPPVTLDAGCTVTFEAIDPNSGAAVSGVVLSAATIYASNVDNPDQAITREPLFALEPLD